MLISLRVINVFSNILLVIILFSCNSSPAINFKKSPSQKNSFKVALMPYANFDTALLNFVKNETAIFYNCEVVSLKSVDLPSFAFYPVRNRYRADSLLKYEKNILPQHVDAIAGLTNKDISTSNGKIPDWGVFGLGMCPGKVCVISVYRLQRASKTASQLKERLIKVVLHELGHNLGLPHCTSNPACLMTDAGGTIIQVDRENKWLCESCKSKLSN
jgi:archaemetzincin